INSRETVANGVSRQRSGETVPEPVKALPHSGHTAVARPVTGYKHWAQLGSVTACRRRQSQRHTSMPMAGTTSVTHNQVKNDCPPIETPARAAQHGHRPSPTLPPSPTSRAGFEPATCRLEGGCSIQAELPGPVVVASAVQPRTPSLRPPPPIRRSFLPHS